MQRLRDESRLTDLHHSPSMKQNRLRIFKGVKRSVTFNLGQNLPVSAPRRGRSIGITRHSSFLGGGFGRKDPLFMTRKDPSQIYHNVPLENLNGPHRVSSQPVVDPNHHQIFVTRSHSFAGMASRSSQLMESPLGTPVLGATYRSKTQHKVPHSPRPRSGANYRKSPKVPKIPRPNWTTLMFESVKKGIREFIEATKDDIDQLCARGVEQATSTAQGKLLETDKQIKAAERYLKRLEFHLSKIEELHDCYMVQQQLREGTRNLQKAYTTSPTSQKDTLSNVKYGMLECIQTMCAIEAQLEAMMGTFHCRIKGMAGFARLCPGDVFDITLRHGSQKWRSRGRVEKTGNQRWENPEYTFKSVIGDGLHIKGVEVRSFKSVILGQKTCETKDLFSCNPQLMTVSINTNGSLKLSVIITWNPLEGVEEAMSYFDVPSRPQSTPRKRPVSVLALNGELSGSYSSLSSDDSRRHSTPPNLTTTKDDNFILRTSGNHSSFSSPYRTVHSDNSFNLQRDSGFSSVIHVPSANSPLGMKRHAPPLPVMEIPEITTNNNIDIVKPMAAPSISPLVTSSPASSLLSSWYSHLHFPVALGHTVTLSKDEPTNVEDVLHSLMTTLEDYHGQYRELEKLEDVVVMLEQILRKHSRCSSRSSSISISIESALGAFDFLNTEEENGDTENHHEASVFDHVMSSPDSTAKTADSGIESLAKRLSEDTQLGSSLGSSPLPPTTENDQVDHALVYHLVYCERLLESLGVYGPLKCREIYALDRLQKQADIIDSLIKISENGSDIDLLSVMSSLTEDKSLREFWARCTDQNLLYIQPEKLVTCLDQKYGAQLRSKYERDPKRVLRHLVMRLLDVPNYDPETIKPTCIVTLHQFMTYFKEEGGLQHVDAVASEINMIEKLCCEDSDTVIKTILQLKDVLPQPQCIKILGVLLMGSDTEIADYIESYLRKINKNKESRDKALVVFAEGLEDKTSEIRAGSCKALQILEATESIDRLAYICQTDRSTTVQDQAKAALTSLGDDGRQAFDDTQLTTHGFQGIQVQK
ncbi:rho family-interacting cell polarization regulator 2-like isoform X5 [Mytilus trossulus]|uniref:rho family-interacting cell polarization regulator 2-like isoform X5 n=1 Tax=Mytilus trossulus TaxID=6551 RepID=UPI00300532F1